MEQAGSSGWRAACMYADRVPAAAAAAAAADLGGLLACRLGAGAERVARQLHRRGGGARAAAGALAVPAGEALEQRLRLLNQPTDAAAVRALLAPQLQVQLGVAAVGKLSVWVPRLASLPPAWPHRDAGHTRQAGLLTSASAPASEQSTTSLPLLSPRRSAARSPHTAAVRRASL